MGQDCTARKGAGRESSPIFSRLHVVLQLTERLEDASQREPIAS